VKGFTQISEFVGRSCHDPLLDLLYKLRLSSFDSSGFFVIPAYRVASVDSLRRESFLEGGVCHDNDW